MVFLIDIVELAVLQVGPHPVIDPAFKIGGFFVQTYAQHGRGQHDLGFHIFARRFLVDGFEQRWRRCEDITLSAGYRCNRRGVVVETQDLGAWLRLLGNRDVVDRKSTRLNSSHYSASSMPSS